MSARLPRLYEIFGISGCAIFQQVFSEFKGKKITHTNRGCADIRICAAAAKQGKGSRIVK